MPPILFAVLSYPFTRLGHFLFTESWANCIIAGAFTYCKRPLNPIGSYAHRHTDVFYDCTHYALHHTKLPAYLREVKKYHLAHHYKNYELGFGVTSTSSTHILMFSAKTTFRTQASSGMSSSTPSSLFRYPSFSVTLHFIGPSLIHGYYFGRFRGETMMHMMNSGRRALERYVAQMGFALGRFSNRHVCGPLREDQIPSQPISFDVGGFFKLLPLPPVTWHPESTSLALLAEEAPHQTTMDSQTTDLHHRVTVLQTQTTPSKKSAC